ncbi:MAG: hypothetical protein LC798_12850 [Chloroflexi bacterium]|nr:hypothetical protein [Chloroflexota bacterium]
MNWLADNYGSMAAVDDPSQGPALCWTAEEMQGWDEDDFEAANLAMDRDMASRYEALEQENAELREALAEGRVQ